MSKLAQDVDSSGGDVETSGSAMKQAAYSAGGLDKSPGPAHQEAGKAHSLTARVAFCFAGLVLTGIMHHVLLGSSQGSPKAVRQTL